MTRIAVVVVLLCGGIAWVYWQGGSDNRLQRQIDHQRDLERIEDATTDNRDADTILERLRQLAK